MCVCVFLQPAYMRMYIHYHTRMYMYCITCLGCYVQVQTNIEHLLLRASADKHRTFVMWYSEVPSHMQIDLHLSFVCVRAACIQVTAEHTHTLSIVA